MSGRFTSKPVYVPESQSITETVRIMQSRGKLKLTIKGQEEALSAKINQKGPASTATDLRPGDEFDGSIVVLTVDKILPYDRNPRTSPNPKYNEIKASIRERKGLKGQLTVTKRPSDVHPNPNPYMLYMGGNTRLQIVKELFTETGERCYGEVNCVFHAWKSEADVLASHLIENEARGDTLFIEKARGLIDLVREIELETGSRLVARDIQAKTAEMGMTVIHSTVLLYEFAVKHLQPLGLWLTRENVNAIKRRYAQYEAVSKVSGKMGEFLDQYPAKTLGYQKEFAETLTARQVALREAGDQTTIVALRGETLSELLRGFDDLLADILALDPTAARRIFAALDAAGKETLSEETLRGLLSGDTTPPDPSSPVSAPNPTKPVPTKAPAAAKAGKALPPPVTDAPTGRGGSTPPRPDTDGVREAPGEHLLPVSNSGIETAGPDPKVAPALITPYEILTPQRVNEFSQWFFSKLRYWCDLTRVEQWLIARDDLDLPYLFWLELPEEIALRGERDVRLEDVPDEDFGMLDPGMSVTRSTSYRLVALLSGQLGGVIEGENGHWTTEMTFAKRLPPESHWRTAALIDDLSTDSFDKIFYNVWDAQLGGHTTQRTCQLAAAPHDLLSVLQQPWLAEHWIELNSAYVLWGQALDRWRTQLKSATQNKE